MNDQQIDTPRAVPPRTPFRCRLKPGLTGRKITADALVMDQPNHLPAITAVLANAPQWLRHDLCSADPKLRMRAEESLAAMIAAAVREARGPTFKG
ncbi:DUF6771 family protein [Sphingobium sp. BS19]|uniref:DUF6771 family protein n=1 Tax=Sphingobium sp. BS19 TaxID=3018973 RepID=UPI00249378BD|nr:DUF6771 family protein [Sphingobium sp. BS19]